MTETHLPQRVEAVRRFNRFYTQQIGLLQEGLLRSQFSLTEARVVYELAHHEQTTATELGRELGIDAGYLSRILADIHKRGLIDKSPSEADRRPAVERRIDGRWPMRSMRRSSIIDGERCYRYARVTAADG